MAKTKISEFSATPGNNTDIDGINIAEGCAPSGINDAIRELMSQLKDFQAGTAGDSFNGPVNGTVGATTPSTGAFTNVTASGTLGVTGVATLGAGAILNTPASITLTNATGLPISTGVSGLGTGVATALAVNVGSAGAPVVNGGALGTPSSGTVTNLTGTASININGTVGATTANTGAFTTLTTSSTVTHNAGTANGVAYLNGSKVLTTGSALTFDGTNLGVGTNSASNKITVKGTDSSSGGINIVGTGSNGLRLFQDGANGDSYISNFQAGALIFAQNNAEGMRLTSTGLGIGTSSPAYKLDVSGANAQSIRVTSSNGDLANLVMNSTGNASWSLSSDTVMRFKKDSTEYMRLDSSGNLGLGVTPSAWGGGLKTIDIGPGSALTNANSLTQTWLSSNAYYTTQWLYKNSAEAAYYDQAIGRHAWYIAPSGTAGSPISFTQAMTLDASGNLLLGTTSSVPSGGVGIRFLADAATPQIAVTVSASSNNYILYNSAASAYRFFVSDAGQINATSTSIAAISDVTFKENIRDLETGVKEVMALRPRRFDWKSETQIGAKNVAGFIAQELEVVLPDLVCDYQYNGQETKKSIKMGDILPTLVKAIQEQQAQIESLTQRLAAAGI